MLFSDLDQFLKTRLEHNTFPQTLLIAGDRTLRKKELVLQCARHLFGAKHTFKIDKGIHPDVHVYSPDEKSGHPIETMREMIERAHQTPYEANFSLFLLEEADKMLPASANTLLKLLEEPPAHAYFILLAERSQALLPTILSRCQILEVFEDNSSLSPLVEHEELIQELFVFNPFLQYLEMLEILASLQKLLEEQKVSEEKVFEAILLWFRDLEILRMGGDEEFLHFKGSQKQLELSSQIYSCSLATAIAFVDKGAKACLQHIKLCHVLESLLLCLYECGKNENQQVVS